MMLRSLLLTLALSCGVLAPPNAACAQTNPAWTRQHAPFRVAGNLYYVGSDDLASYLITTPQGHILINSNLVSSVPQIRRNVEALGFRFSDVKILLISHGHFDHCAGSALVKRLTGAKYMVMDADVPLVESGGRKDFALGGSRENWFPATRVDRVLHDGDEVRLGDALLVAHKTPGHTRGCTTWTLRVQDGGRMRDVVIVGSTSVLSNYRLVEHTSYPGIAQDFERTFAVLKGLPCDVFLGAHGSYFEMQAKYARLGRDGVNPFVDPQGYRRYVAEAEQDFETDLARQRAR